MPIIDLGARGLYRATRLGKIGHQPWGKGTKPMEDGQVNISKLVVRHACTHPEKLALVIPEFDTTNALIREETCTYAGLARRIAQARAGLTAQGFKRNDRLILMAPLSIDTYALLLALFASGMSAVFIDGGMGKKKVLQAIADAKAQGIVSVRSLLRYRWFLKVLWTLKLFGTDCQGLGVRSWRRLFHHTPSTAPVVTTSATDHALITFTSGSTGRPKGADRTQGLLVQQHLALERHFPIGECCVDLPCFPVVALHNLCLGITTVLPAVNLAAPATVRPQYVFEQIKRWGVKRLSGAPAYIDALIASIESGEHRGDGIESIGIGGAPVSVDLCRRIRQVLPTCDIQIIYGSTEAEPIASVSVDEIIETHERSRVWGHLVGEPAHCADIALVNLPSPPPTLTADDVDPYRVPSGHVGELIVRGPHVNRGYLDNPTANSRHKLVCLNGQVWHRTGDLARLDEQGRIWLCGRVKDRIGCGPDALNPLPIEAQVNGLDGVKRAALVAVSDDGPVGLFVQTEPDWTIEGIRSSIEDALMVHTQRSIPLIALDAMPVDYRHQSKIDRVKLRRHLEEQ
ncbi:MAG: AMP-binding protein [Myxococcota bacterium]|nr:AMP-binding protein [Myxococcota bacterium]